MNKDKDENGSTDKDVKQQMGLTLTDPDTVQELKDNGLEPTEENLLLYVRQTLDKMVKEGTMYRDPHGRYYGSEHPVAKAYKLAGY